MGQLITLDGSKELKGLLNGACLCQVDIIKGQFGLKKALLNDSTIDHLIGIIINSSRLRDRFPEGLLKFSWLELKGRQFPKSRNIWPLSPPFLFLCGKEWTETEGDQLEWLMSQSFRDASIDFNAVPPEFVSVACC